MKRMLVSLCVLALVVAFSGVALAQDQAPRGEKAFKMMDANSDGKITKEEFVSVAQKRAEERFAKLDKDNKGYLTKEDFMAAKEKAKERFKNRKAKSTDTPQ